MATPRWFKRRLTHACIVRRDSGTGQTGSGQITPSWTSVYTAQPLRFTERVERVAAEGVGAAMVEQNVALMNGTADVLPADRIAGIVDAGGNSIGAGTYTVERVLVRRRVDGTAHHKSLQLERVGIG